jgi:hypothetical protein
MRTPAMAAAPAAMKPERWIEAAPAVAGAEGVAEALLPVGVLLALIRGVEELAMWLIEGVALEEGVLVMTGVQVEVEVGVGVGVDDGGAVYPEGTRVMVLVIQSAEADSAANATGARAERKRRALVNCIVDVWLKVVMILRTAN